jgi:hypothetical protein
VQTHIVSSRPSTAKTTFSIAMIVSGQLVELGSVVFESPLIWQARRSFIMLCLFALGKNWRQSTANAQAMKPLRIDQMLKAQPQGRKSNRSE